MPVDQQTPVEPSSDVRVAWARLLDAVPWDHWATLTFRYPVSGQAAERECRRFIRRLEQRAQSGVECFFVAEMGALGTTHSHCLVEHGMRLGVNDVQAAWRSGNSRVQLYRPSGGATYYLTKFCLDERSIYDWHRPTPLIRNTDSTT